LNAKLAGCGIVLLALTVTAGAAGQGQSTAAPKSDVKRRGAYQDYQVPAGTWLFIELRTQIASDTSQRADVIRGVLKSAVTQDGVELVPSGSVVLGTVTDVSAALNRMDRARLVFRFNVLEHPLTGSRVPIKTEGRVLEVEAGKKKPSAKGAAAFNQVRLEPGTDVSMPIHEPFVVRIPDESKAGK
jgi:hypothetical protein